MNALPLLTEKNIRNFWKHVDKDQSGCWVWRGALAGKGYGKLTLCGSTFYAHRISYFLHYGTDPNTMQVCHRCDYPVCVNPIHLFLGTNDDNIHDKILKGRQPQGTAIPQAILTPVDVLDIRSRYVPRRVTSYALAEEYGVSRGTITAVVNRINWKHL